MEIRLWVSLFVVAGALFTSTATSGLLHDAARNGNVNQVKTLLKQGTDVNTRTETGESPLHWAAFGGHTAVINQLLKSGADVNAQNGFGSTPLHWAIAQGHQQIVEALLRGGGDINLQDYVGNPPLQWAIVKNKGAVADLLRAHGALARGTNCSRELIVGPLGEEGFRTECW